MNLLPAPLTYAVEIGMYGLAWAGYAAKYAALLAAAVLLTNLVLRRWLTAGQKNVLWGLVLLRLLMPLAPVSFLSLQNLSLPTTVNSVLQQPAQWLPALDLADSADELPGVYSAPSTAEIPEQPQELSWEDIAVELSWLAWTCVLMFVLSRTAIVHFRFSRRVNGAPVCQDTRIVELWKSCREQAGVRRAIPIVWCDALGQPALMGLLGPKLLLPTDVAELADDPLRMIMLHELAHVRRHDIAFNWIIVLIRAIHWWNPVYWLAASRFASLREQACDDFVLRRMTGDRKRDYSELLLTLAGREPAGFGWRVTLPASILGFVASFFRRWSVRQRLWALRSAGLKPNRGRTILAAAAIALTAIGGLTDAMPQAELSPTALDWVPAINLNAPAHESDDGPLVTREYDLSEVLARIDADASMMPNAGAELKSMIEWVLQIQRMSINQDGSPPTPSQATYTLDGPQLTVHACERLQHELAEIVKIWQQSGFGQIQVEFDFITADHDIAQVLGATWQFQETLSVDSERSLPTEGLAAPPVRAGASVTEYFPVMAATLNKQQAQMLLQRPWSRTSLQIAAFNGQRVTLGDRTQTPFVVGIHKNQTGWEEPIIRVLEDGTTLAFRAVHSSDRQRVHLKGSVEIKKLGDVHDVRTTCNGQPAIVQAPCGKRWRIDFDSTVDEGQSVLIGFVPTYEQKLIVYALLTVKTIVPDTGVAAN